VCVFCGEGPLDEEHLLGDWINRNPRLAMPGEQTHFIGTVPGPQERYLSDKHDQTVPCVCGWCNHGWMSNMEKAVSRFLPDVATEAAPEFPERAHLVMALWAVTRAMVKQYQAPSPDPLLIPPEQYAYVHAHLEPPPATFVFQLPIRLRFEIQGHGWIAMDGVAISKFIAVLEFGNAGTPLELGWRGNVSKGAVHLGLASFPALPSATDELARSIFQDLDGLVQIWPLKTKESQIRVRHPRGPRPR